MAQLKMSSRFQGSQCGRAFSEILNIMMSCSLPSLGNLILIVGFMINIHTHGHFLLFSNDLMEMCNHESTRELGMDIMANLVFFLKKRQCSTDQVITPDHICEMPTADGKPCLAVFSTKKALDAHQHSEKVHKIAMPPSTWQFVISNQCS